MAPSNGTPVDLEVAARLCLPIGLENRRTLIASPGFESLVSRQDLHESLAKAGLLRFLGLGVLIIKQMLFVAFIPFKDEPPFV